MASSEVAHVVIKSFLYGIKPEIWRRLSLPRAANFFDLHLALQAAFGWHNKHPHEFRHGKTKKLVDVIGPNGLQELCIGEFQDETKVSLESFLGRRRLPIRILYRYDFADEWIHEVVFEKPALGPPHPVLLDGARACPPEDFGGAFHFMQALAGEVEWMNPSYDPCHFELHTHDAALRKIRCGY